MPVEDKKRKYMDIDSLASRKVGTRTVDSDSAKIREPIWCDKDGNLSFGVSKEILLKGCRFMSKLLHLKGDEQEERPHQEEVETSFRQAVRQRVRERLQEDLSCLGVDSDERGELFELIHASPASSPTSSPTSVEKEAVTELMKKPKKRMSHFVPKNNPQLAERVDHFASGFGLVIQPLSEKLENPAHIAVTESEAKQFVAAVDGTLDEFNGSSAGDALEAFMKKVRRHSRSGSPEKEGEEAPPMFVPARKACSPPKSPVPRNTASSGGKHLP